MGRRRGDGEAGGGDGEAARGGWEAGDGRRRDLVLRQNAFTLKSLDSVSALQTVAIDCHNSTYDHLFSHTLNTMIVIKF